MILATVGTQLPFDRLISVLDDIAGELAEPIFAQTGVSTYRPRHIEYAQSVSAAEMDRRMRDASLIVAHAGIGTIIAARRCEKPLILFPRQARYGEHRNDHQLATCAQLKSLPNVSVANDEDELRDLIARPSIRVFQRASGTRSASLADNLGAFLVSMVKGEAK